MTQANAVAFVGVPLAVFTHCSVHLGERVEQWYSPATQGKQKINTRAHYFITLASVIAKEADPEDHFSL